MWLRIATQRASVPLPEEAFLAQTGIIRPGHDTDRAVGEDQVRASVGYLNQGVIKPEGELVGDTTHYHGWSGFEPEGLC